MSRENFQISSENHDLRRNISRYVEEEFRICSRNLKVLSDKPNFEPYLAFRLEIGSRLLMKLLLTSAGITNKKIADALFELVRKKAEDTALVFIPTASNKEKGDKSWLINDLVNLQKQNFKSIDIADISVEDQTIWLPKLEEADVLFFEGGDTYHLMSWITKSGLDLLLGELLKTKVYVGSSAGSMVTGKDLALKISQMVYGEDFDEIEEMKGLNFVDFYFLPHLNSSYFDKVREKEIKEATEGMKEKVYAMDDNSALRIVDGNVEVVSTGEWFVVN